MRSSSGWLLDNKVTDWHCPSGGGHWFWISCRDETFPDSRPYYPWMFYRVTIFFWFVWDSKKIKPVNPKGISPEYSLERLMLKLKLQYFGTWCEELTQWKRPWCWETLKAGEEVDDRGWHGWMASLIWWTRVSIGSRVCWWTGRPGVLQSMWSQREGQDWATELNWLLVKMAYRFLNIHYAYLLSFNWRILTLQCCIGFCHTTTWNSLKYTYISSFLNLPPLPAV